MLKKHLMPLCHPKRGRLLAKGKPDFKNMDDTMEVNLKLKQPNIKLNLLPPQERTTSNNNAGGGDSGIDPKLLRQRQMQIQCQAVKWMKSSIDAGGMKYGDLTQKVMESIRTFKAQPAMIKEQVETLIIQEYFKRDEKERGKLVYLA